MLLHIDSFRRIWRSRLGSFTTELLVSFRPLCFSKCHSHNISSVVHVFWGKFSVSPNLCSCWSKLSSLRKKKHFLGTPSDADKDIFPVKMDKFGAASCYHSDEIQRTHQVLTGCQWSLGFWIYHLLTSNLPTYRSHCYLQTWLKWFLLIWEVPRNLFWFPKC